MREPLGGAGRAKPGKLELVAIADDDILQQARVALRAMANGRGGRQATTRRAAAEFLLSKAYLPHLTDRQLFYEVRRRRVALNARSSKRINYQLRTSGSSSRGLISRLRSGSSSEPTDHHRTGGAGHIRPQVPHSSSVSSASTGRRKTPQSPQMPYRFRVGVWVMAAP
jgi:hypothetical protein